MTRPRIIVIGAGPAGLRAVETLAKHGHRPILLDEGSKAGGQIYRQPPAGLMRPAKALYGFDADKAVAIHGVLARLALHIDYRPNALAWHIWQGSVFTVRNGLGEAIPFDRLILATGALDRVFPLPGWTRPGVYSLGGSQIALKFQGCAVGRRVVFLGSGPLLYLVAYQYAKAGAQVAAVLDTAPFAAKLGALVPLARGGRHLAQGLFYLGWLKSRRIAVRTGVTPLGIEGTERVAGVRYRVKGRDSTVACDAVGLGFGLRSEAALADLAGCRFAFDPVDRQWAPVVDRGGRSSVPGIYCAGDGMRIGGADAAELMGERAALALLEDCGDRRGAARAAAIERQVDAFDAFRIALQRAFPFPADLARGIADDTVLCRCEGVPAGAVRHAARALGVREVNRLKSFTRIGMGRCQGRACGAAAAEILAGALDCRLEEVGRLRAQPPVKPLPMAVGMAPR